jgi:hypothetical protein
MPNNDEVNRILGEGEQQAVDAWVDLHKAETDYLRCKDPALLNPLCRLAENAISRSRDYWGKRRAVLEALGTQAGLKAIPFHPNAEEVSRD